MGNRYYSTKVRLSQELFKKLKKARTEAGMSEHKFIRSLLEKEFPEKKEIVYTPEEFGVVEKEKEFEAIITKINTNLKQRDLNLVLDKKTFARNKPQVIALCSKYGWYIEELPDIPSFSNTTWAKLVPNTIPLQGKNL